MQITTEKRGAVEIVSTKGSLDVITSPELERKLLELIDGGAKSLLLDMATLDYISSAGLRVIMMALKKMKALGGHIRFSGLCKQVQQIFNVAGISFRVEIFPTADAALANFPAPVKPPATA